MTITAPRTGYYVTALRGTRYAWLAGPYHSREIAELLVPLVRRTAIGFDPFMHFDAFGVSKIIRADDDSRPLINGHFNHMLGRY